MYILPVVIMLYWRLFDRIYFLSIQVLFALYEKDVVFKPKLVSLFSGQHNEPWYMKLNPDGHHVPVLKHGGRTVADPSLIIDYISQETTQAGNIHSHSFIMLNIYNN